MLGLVILVTGVYFEQRQKSEQRNPQISGIVYDKSIQTQYGQPIKVARVIDGDTIELINGDRVRYMGMDTPEEFDKRKPVQCFALEAANKNRELVEGKEIKFYKDVSDRDKYGRWLGYVYLADGTFVNLALVKDGYAFAYPYPPDISKSADFEKAQETARMGKLGLWAGCNVSTEKSGREQTNSVQ